MNPRQREAVRYLDGPLLVLAGAGSGKTRVIVEKITYLIRQRYVAAERIAAITFTNKAASEMHARLPKQRNEAKPWISTFHTLGLRILRREFAYFGLKPGFSIVDSRDCEAILADLSRRELTNDAAQIRQLQNQISLWKCALATPDPASETDASHQLAARCFNDYRDTLIAYNAVDFDDLIVLPVRLLREQKKARQYWRKQIEYLLIDEYQDTNDSQYELARLLAGEQGKLTAVGDDDQSIYAWRGAKPENLVRLSQDYPQLKVIKLEQNYRSSGVILNAANGLIANNPHVFDKRLWSEHGPGDKIQIYAAKDEHAEVEFVANQIMHQRLVRSGRYGDYAVLFRSNHQARLFEHALRERGIPYVVSGGKSFFDYTEVKDLVCYLRIITNPADNNALLRIINTPRRSLGATTVKALVTFAGERELSLVEAALQAQNIDQLATRAQKALCEFAEWLVSMERLAHDSEPLAACKQLISDIDYHDWLAHSSDSDTETERRADNVAELMQWIERVALNDPSKTLTDVVASLTLFDILERQEDDDRTDQVSLMTLHAAKGLEFNHVHLVGVEEGILPHRSSIEQGTVEEERRLAYVGITRARKTLSISFAERRRRYGEFEESEPSRFIEELPSDDLVWDKPGKQAERNVEAAQQTLSNLRNMLETP